MARSWLALLILCTLLSPSGSIGQSDTLVDVLPLSVGNRWIYDYFTYYNWYKPPTIYWDSGSAQVTITAREVRPDTVVWSVEELQHIFRHWRFCNFGCLDTFYTFDTTFRFNIYESQSGNHSLSADCGYPYNASAFHVSVFYFGCLAGFASDTGLVTRYARVDSSETIRDFVWSPADGHASVFMRDVGLVSDSIHYSHGVTSERDATLISFTLGTAEAAEGSLPRAISLSQNFPNPFNPSTTIAYRLPQATHVRISIFSLLGQEVALLADGVVQPGEHTVRWNPGNMPGGVYYCRLTTSGGVSETRRMLLLR